MPFLLCQPQDGFLCLWVYFSNRTVLKSRLHLAVAGSILWSEQFALKTAGATAMERQDLRAPWHPSPLFFFLQIRWIDSPEVWHFPPYLCLWASRWPRKEMDDKHNTHCIVTPGGDVGQRLSSSCCLPMSTSFMYVWPFWQHCNLGSINISIFMQWKPSLIIVK